MKDQIPVHESLSHLGVHHSSKYHGTSTTWTTNENYFITLTHFSDSFITESKITKD